MSIAKSMYVNDLINCYPLDTLKCFDRPKVIVMENLCKNSMYYRLLFNEMIYDRSFAEFIKMKTGVSFEEHIYPLNDFHSVILSLLMNDTPVLLCIDHLLEDMWKDYVPGEHEQHTLVVYDYDSREKCYSLIDQDYTKDYFSTSNIRQKMVYCKRKISAEKLVMLAANAYKAFTEVDQLDESHFLLYVPLRTDSRQSCSWETIELDYKKMIHRSLLQLSDYRSDLIKGTNEVIHDFSKLTQCKNIDYDYKYIWLRYDGYVVPNEIGALFNRSTSLKMYKVFLEYYAKDVNEWSGIIESLNDVYSVYELCKNLFRKSVYTNNLEWCKRVADQIERLLGLERKFYECILHNDFSFKQIMTHIK